MDNNWTPPSGFLQAAAEKAIDELRVQVSVAQNSADQAKVHASSVAKSARRWKVLTLVLGVVVLLCGYLVFQQHQEAIAACNNGNARATGIVVALDELVTLLEGPHPTAKTRAAAAQYENFVAMHNAQRNCNTAYSFLP